MGTSMALFDIEIDYNYGAMGVKLSASLFIQNFEKSTIIKCLHTACF